MKKLLLLAIIICYSSWGWAQGPFDGQVLTIVVGDTGWVQNEIGDSLARFGDSTWVRLITDPMIDSVRVKTLLGTKPDTTVTNSLQDSTDAHTILLDALLTTSQADSDTVSWDATKTWLKSNFVPTGASVLTVGGAGQYATIAAAVAAADSGDVILLCRGTYTDTNVVLSGQSIVGNANHPEDYVWTGGDTLCINSKANYFEGILFNTTGSGNMVVNQVNIPVTYNGCIFWGEQYELSPDASGAEIVYINPLFLPTAVDGFKVLGDDWVWVYGTRAQLGFPTGKDTPSWFSGVATYGILVDGYLSVLGGGGWYSNGVVFRCTSGNLSTYRKPIVYAQGADSSALVIDSCAVNFYQGGTIDNSSPSGGAPTIYLTDLGGAAGCSGTIRLYNAHVVNKGGGAAVYNENDTGVSWFEGNSLKTCGGEDYGNASVFTSMNLTVDTSATNPATKIEVAADQFYVANEFRVGRGNALEIFAFGISAFVGQEDSATVNVPGLLYDASGNNDTLVVIQAQNFGTPGVSATSDIINYVAQNASGAFIVQRHGSTGTSGQKFSWIAMQNTP